MRCKDIRKILKGANKLHAMKIYLRPCNRGNKAVLWLYCKRERKSLGMPGMDITKTAATPQEIAFLKKAVAKRDDLEKQSGKFTADSKMKLSEVMREWVEHYSIASTRKDARVSGKKILDIIGDIPAGSMSRRHFIAALDTLGKTCTPNYIRVILSRIRAFCNWAEQRGYMERIDTRKLSPPATFGEIKALSENEIKALSAAPCENYPDVKDLFMLGIYTAQRMGEIENYAFSVLCNKEIRTRQGKTGKFIVIPLSQYALGIMERLKERREKEGKPTGESDKMFSLPSATMRHRVFKAWVKAAGLPEGKVTPHNSRSTAISLLIKKGVPESVTQELANHSSPVITARYYRQIDTEQKKAALDKLPEF
jgi:integrase